MFDLDKLQISVLYIKYTERQKVQDIQKHTHLHRNTHTHKNTQTHTHTHKTRPTPWDRQREGGSVEQFCIQGLIIEMFTCLNQTAVSLCQKNVNIIKVGVNFQ